jgi:phage major head subunit gpT-like protein
MNLTMLIAAGFGLLMFSGVAGFGGSSGGVTTNAVPTVRGLNASFYAGLKEGYALWKKICTVVSSGKAGEDYAWLGQMRAVREWKDVRGYKPVDGYSLAIDNKHWEDGVAIDRDHLADDQTGMLAIQPRELATRFLQHPTKLAVDLLINGHTDTHGLAFDGQYFFDTDHVSGNSGSQSNDLTGAIVAKDTPTVAEFKAAFTACVVAMLGFKDDQGEQLIEAVGEAGLSGLVVCVPLTMLQVATEALKAAIVGNNSNILVSQAEVVAIPRMDADTFEVLKTDEPAGPIIFQQRQNFDTKLVDDPHNKYVEYMADARYAMGYGLWQKAVRYEFTTAGG